MVVWTGWSLDKFGFPDVCGNGQDAIEWGIYPEGCMQAVGVMMQLRIVKYASNE